MKTHSLTHKQLLLDRVGVAWAFFCSGSIFGVLLSTWLPATFLSNRLNLVWAFLAVMFGLVYPVMLLLVRLQRRDSGVSHEKIPE